jgi:hypothetical protein
VCVSRVCLAVGLVVTLFETVAPAVRTRPSRYHCALLESESSGFKTAQPSNGVLTSCPSFNNTPPTMAGWWSREEENGPTAYAWHGSGETY